MSTCILNSGYSLGCKDNIGGIRRVYIGNFADDNIYVEDADNIITSMLNSTSGAITYYTFEQRQESGEFNENGNHSVENGTTFYEQVLSLIFTKNEATLRNTLFLLAKSTLSVIVETQNGRYILMGKINAVNMTASTVATGKAYGDLNGTNVTLTGKEPQSAQEISAAGFATLTIV